MESPGDGRGRQRRAASRRARWARPGPRVVFVHGLFGQGKNWTTIAKGLADSHRVTLLDLPNHGHSPWTDRVDYLDMAELVATELEQLGEPVTLVGHSMGGKVAMQLALRRPELLRALVVVDIAPVRLPGAGRPHRRPGRGGVAVRAPTSTRCGRMDLDALQTRDDADAGAAGRRPQPDGAQLPAAEPGPGGAGRRTAAGAGG